MTIKNALPLIPLITDCEEMGGIVTQGTTGTYEWFIDNKVQYDKAVRFINKQKKHSTYFSIYCFCDTSGYDYFKNSRGERQYFTMNIDFVTQKIRKRTVHSINFHLNRLKSRIEKFINEHS